MKAMTTEQRTEFDRLLYGRSAVCPKRKDPDVVREDVSQYIQSRKWRTLPRPHWCTSDVDTCGTCFCPEPEQESCSLSCWACT